MSVYLRGKVWQYDFWVRKKRYQSSIPEAQNKTQARMVENRIRAEVFEATYCLPDKQLPREPTPKKLALVAPGKKKPEIRANIITFRSVRRDGSPVAIERAVVRDADGPALFVQDPDTGDAVIFDWPLVRELMLGFVECGESYFREHLRAAAPELADAPPQFAPESETVH